MYQPKAYTDFFLLTPHLIGVILNVGRAWNEKNEISGFCSELTNFLTLKTKKIKNVKSKQERAKKASKSEQKNVNCKQRG